MASYPASYGSYVLLERLGVGGMSEVDLARKAVEEAGYVRFLVIKRIKADRSDDETFVRMFKDEARITAELHHANIAQVYDFGRHEDEYFMTLEYVPGVDLRRVINVLRERRQRVPVRVSLRVLADVLSALEYAHSKVDQFGRPMHIVHRDVNPRNVMLSVRGETKLIDFGVAKATGRLERTQTDHVKGKFAYMAPEQVTAKEHDHRADLFAVGLCLHELITGYSPFHGLNQVQIMHRLLSQRVPPLQSTPSEFTDGEYLKRVHRKALETDPALRYQSAAEFRRDLENLAAPIGGLATLDEMSRFLRYVEPELTDELQRKMEEYAKPLDLSTTAPAAPIAFTEPGTMTGMSMIATGGSTVTRAGAMIGGVFVGSALVAGAVAALALGGLLIWKWEVLFPSGPATPAAVTIPADRDPRPAREVDRPPVPTDPPEVDPSVSGEAPAASTKTPSTADPASEPSAPRAGERDPSAVGPAATTATPPRGDSPPATLVAEASPVAPADPGPVEPPPTDPAPVVAATADASAGEAPVDPVRDAPVSPGEGGTLQITSNPRGRAIRIDGKDTGMVTPAQLEWAVGTVTITVDGFDDQQVTVRRNQRVPVIFK